MSVNNRDGSKRFNNPIIILDTTDAVNSTTGSLVLYGGLSVASTANLSGIMRISNNTTSTDVSTGALVIGGGVGIDDNLNVGGNAYIQGSLTAGSFAVTNLNAGTITVSTLIGSNATLGNLFSTNITTATLRASTIISSANITANLMTTGTLLATTGITTSNIYVSSDSAGLNLYGGARILKASGDGMYIIPHNDGNLGDGIGGIKFRNAANNTTSMQVFGDGTLRVAGIVSAANMATNALTVGTLVASTVNTTFLSATNVFVSDITSATLRATLLVSSANIAANIITTGTLNAATLISSANIAANVITTGTLSAIGNSNTIGSIFTTGGNVGIGTTSPTAKLSVNGAMTVNGNITGLPDGSGINFYIGRIYKKGGAGLQIVSGAGDTQFRNYIDSLTTMSISDDGILSVTTRVSSANIAANVITTGTLLAGTIGTTLLSATTITAANAHLSGNMFIAGTLTAVNITTTNLMDTNITAGIANITNTLSAIGTSNTIGGIFTTGGNVGIGRTAPSYKLDVNGTLRTTGGDATLGTLRLTSTTIALGSNAGNTSQGSTAVAIGSNAGSTSQGSSAIAMGNQAGNTSQGQNAIAMGFLAGNTSQGDTAIAMGTQAGNTSQGYGAIAMGTQAGNTSQSNYAVAMGTYAGKTSQGGSAIAIGFQTGTTSQGIGAIAMGSSTGEISQRDHAIAMGTQAGNTSQGSHAIAIGRFAGQSSQGNNAIAMGYQAGQTNQHTNSIILNASLTALNSATAGAFYVSSVRNVTQANLLAYDTTLKEITYFSLSNFTTSNLVATNITATNITANIITTSSLLASSGSVSNMISTVITTGKLIANTVDITPSIGDIGTENWTYLANNASGIVSGLAFNNNTVRSFTAVAHIEIQRSTGGNLYAKHDLSGLQLSSNWILNQNFIGENTGVVFGINSTGQVSYTCANISNYRQSIMHYRASVTNTTSGSLNVNEPFLISNTTWYASATSPLHYNNWSSIFSLNKISTYQPVLTGSGASASYQLSDGAYDANNILYTSSPIQNSSGFIFKFNFDAFFSSPDTSSLFAFFGGTSSTIGSNGDSTSYTLTINTGNSPTPGFYLYRSGSQVASYITNDILGTIINNTLIIQYTKETTNTLRIYYGGVNILNYSDANIQSWVSAAGTYYGIGCRDIPYTDPDFFFTVGRRYDVRNVVVYTSQ